MPREARPRGSKTYDKPPLSHDELLERLKSRGLFVSDDNRALRYLGRIGYYRLTAYMVPFQLPNSDHQFKPGASFDDILYHYIFDRRLRLLVLDAIERIEVAIRAAITDAMSERHDDPFWYTNSKHFARADQHATMLSKVRESCKIQLQRRPENEGDHLNYPSALEHYLTTYGEPELPPSWLVTQELTIGSLDKMFSALKHSEQERISASLNLRAPLLRSWLLTLVRLRNVCAHHARLWNIALGVAPATPRSPNVPWVRDTGQIGNSAEGPARLYRALVVIQSLMHQISPESSWAGRLWELLGEFDEIPKRAMGMPEAWEDDEFWSVPILRAIERGKVER